MPPLIDRVQPPPFRVPLLDASGQLVETWRRFFLTSQVAITQILAAKPSALAGTQQIAIDDSNSFDDVFPPLTGGFSGIATFSGVLDDNTTNAAMYPVWVSATPGTEQLETSSTELVWNPGLGAFGFQVVPPDNQYRVIIKAAAASSISALSLRMNLGSAPTTFSSRVMSIVDEAFTHQLFSWNLSSTVVQLLAGASAVGLGLEVGTSSATDLTFKTTNLVRWTLYSGGGFSNTGADPGANIVAQGGLLALGTTSTDGIVLENDTLSTALIPTQQSPRLRFRSHVWNTTTPADNTNDWWIESRPSSAATPSGVLKFGSSLNGATATYPLTLTDAGNLTILGDWLGSNLKPSGSIFAGATSGFFFGSFGGFSGANSDGKVILRTNISTTGVALDGSTDALLKIRTRALTGDASLSALNITTSGTLIDKSYNIATPATLATVVMSANQQRQIINPAGTIAVLTVTLPSSPVDGQIAGISFTQIVSAVTINAPGGATVVGPPTSAAVNSEFQFIYQASSTSWFPAA